MKKALHIIILLSAAAAAGSPLMAAANGAGYYDTSEYLMGSIAVNIVFPESNGAIQANTENWNDTRKGEVVDQIHQAMNWWADREPRARLSFVYPTPVTIATGYEPINCHGASGPAGPPYHEGDWIGQVMATLGHASTDYFEQVYSYNNAARTANGTDWAITIFVVDSDVDGDGEFADGMFAYAYLGGPFMVMTYDNDGYGIFDMKAVAAHELGHLFYALDEYAASGCATSEYAGYLNIQNVNCENSRITDTDCIMRGDTPPYVGYDVCDASRRMLGWWDSADADTALDIAGFTPVTELPAYFPDPTSDNTPTYNGIARSTAVYPNSNPYDNSTNHYWYASGVSNNMSVLKIAGVEYNINGGAWQAAAATDGSFGASIESFTFTTASLPDAAYTFRARAKNIFDVYDPAPPSDTLTINTALPANIPYVNDGTGGDIQYVSSLNTLSANWGASYHVSGIDHYDYGIGKTPGVRDVVAWTPVGTALNVIVTGLSLLENTSYYFSVQAFGNGYHTGASVSNGQLTDTVSPRAKVEISSPLPAKTGPLTLKLIVDERNGLSGNPTLTFSPAGSSSQPVTLSSLLPSTWTGTAFIESFYSTGTAAFSFRAVDPAGNVGTLITAGPTFVINTAVDGAAGGTVVNSDNSGVIVPAGAYTGSLVLNISTVAPSRLAHANSFASNSAPLMANDVTREFAARTPAGVPVTSFGAPVTIRLCYPDANNDGRIDGDFVSEDLARLYWLDESASRWVQLKDGRLNVGENCISADTSHFSVYTIRTMDASQFGMGNLKAFPSPCYFDRDPNVLTIRGIPPDAQKAEIYIYNSAGELVRQLKRGDGIDDFNEGLWDGKQKGGSKAASGLYIYLAKTANFGNGTGKFYIFW